MVAANNIELRAPYWSRPASLDDLEAAVDFFNLCEIDESGVPDYDLDEVRSEWRDLDLASNSLLVLDSENQIVASMILSPNGKDGFGASGYTHPAHRDRGLGGAILEWASARAASGPWDGEHSLVIRNWISVRNLQAAALLENTGFVHAKRFNRMGIELTAPPPTPQLPSGYEFRPVDVDKQSQEIYLLIEDAFSEHWSGHQRSFEEWKESTFGFGYDPQFWFQVFRGDKRVGASIGQNLSGLGWIKSIGVLAEARGKGIGKAILLQAFANYWNAGLTRVELGVDTENVTNALALYEGAGMAVVNSYDAYEKRIDRADRPV